MTGNTQAVPTYAIVARALIILSIAVGVLHSTRNLPLVLPGQWNSWILANVILLLPVTLLCGHVTLSDPPQEFGWRRGEWKFGLRWSLGLFGVMLPVLVMASRLEAVAAFYRLQYLPPVNTAQDALALAATTTAYMLAWEWFFRGFLLFGLKPVFGVGSVVFQAAAFMLMHVGKPTLEVGGSLIAGLALGGVCWRTGAWWPGFITHALCHVTWNWLVTR